MNNKNKEDLQILSDAMVGLVDCPHFKPLLNEYENRFYFLCSEGKELMYITPCMKDGKSKIVATVGHGNGKSRIVIAMCDKCFDVLKHNMELLKDKLRDNVRLTYFLDNADVDVWQDVNY